MFFFDTPPFFLIIETPLIHFTDILDIERDDIRRLGPSDVRNSFLISNLGSQRSEGASGMLISGSS